LVCWADRSQDGDYDADQAALHLAAIGRARDTFKRAAVMFSRGLFDALALASVREGPRPDFRFGSVCCATAHETAHELLRRALFWMEDALCDLNIGTADELHNLSADALRDTLSCLEKISSAQGIVYAPETHQVRAWIHREWAAVSGKREAPPPKTEKARRGKKAQAERAIRHYLVDRQSYYDSLKPRCQQHEVRACKQAKGEFGRNILSKTLGLSAGLVSNTLAWKQIKADLFPDSPGDLLSKLRHSGGRVGFSIAEEAAGQARGDQTFDAVVRDETLESIREANLPEAAADQLVSQLQAGEITNDAARDMLENFREGEANRLADIEAEQRPRKRRRNRNSDR
jgi:hypothetical protein